MLRRDPREVRATLTDLLAILLVGCSANGQDSYDLVILNGRVMDPETELDAVHNVGIKDERIAVITEEAIDDGTLSPR